MPELLCNFYCTILEPSRSLTLQFWRLWSQEGENGGPVLALSSGICEKGYSLSKKKDIPVAFHIYLIRFDENKSIAIPEVSLAAIMMIGPASHSSALSLHTEGLVKIKNDKPHNTLRYKSTLCRAESGVELCI